MKIEIITPDYKVFEGDIKSIRVPGRKGSFQVLKDHAPIISTLENGPVIMVDQADRETRYEISGGVIEVKMNKIILLVESVNSLVRMTPDEFRKHAHELVEWMAGYLENVEKYPVRSQVAPGDIFKQIPDKAPSDPQPFGQLMKDFDEIIMPGSHTGRIQIFCILPGQFQPSFHTCRNDHCNDQCTMHELGNITAAAELEEKMMIWLRDLIGLPGYFEGVIQDTASTATLAAIITQGKKQTGFAVNNTGAVSAGT